MVEIFWLLTAGAALRFAPGIDRTRTATVCDQLVLWVALPSMVLVQVPRLEWTSQAMIPTAVAWGVCLGSAAAVATLARLRGWTTAQTGTLMLVVPLANTSFLGIPAVEALLGADHVPFAILYDQPGSFLALSTYGSIVAARYGALVADERAREKRPTTASGVQAAVSQGGAVSTLPKADVASIIKKVVTFPAFVALVAAIIVRQTGLPDSLDEAIGRLGSMLTPLVMLAIGLRLVVPKPKDLNERLAIGLLLRLVAAPAAVFAVRALLNGSGPVWETTQLESAMPSMVTASIVAAGAGLDERLATDMVGLGLVASLLTLPIWAGIAT